MLTIWVLLSLFNFNHQQTDPCKVYGTVFIESNKSYAKYLVFEEESEAFADLLVFKQENKFFADNSGLWHITTNRAIADVTIYFTTKKNQADFSIHYIDNESFAGCK